MLGSPPPRQPLDVRTRQVLHAAANRGEALINVLRAGFCTLVMLRFLALEVSRGGALGVRSAVELTTLSAAILGSVWMWRMARGQRLGPRAWALSGLADTVVCFASLLSTVLQPVPGDPGILHLPDPAAFVVIVAVGALRISSAATWVGMVSAWVLLGVLVAVERALSPEVPASMASLSLLTLLIGAAGVVALVAGNTARRLALESATSSERAVQARWQLSALLREHHDVRSVLSAARLRAELLAREPLAAEASRHAVALREDLNELDQAIRKVKEQAQGDLLVLDALEATPLAPVLSQCLAAIARRFPAVALSVGDVDAGLSVRVLGGSRGLHHLLSNLLTNACEGDGSRHAARVWLEVHHADGSDQARLVIRDDGPGFPAQVTQAGVPNGWTSKADGSGLGLMFVSALLEDGRGRLALTNPPEGGAQVVVELPAVPSAGTADAVIGTNLALRA